MIMQNTATGTIWCTGAVLAVLALDFLTGRFLAGQADDTHPSRQGAMS